MSPTRLSYVADYCLELAATSWVSCFFKCAQLCTGNCSKYSTGKCAKVHSMQFKIFEMCKIVIQKKHCCNSLSQALTPYSQNMLLLLASIPPPAPTVNVQGTPLRRSAAESMTAATRKDIEHSGPLDSQLICSKGLP